MRILTYIAILVLATTARGSFLQRSDSGIYGPPYKKILAWTEKLAIQYPRLATTIDYGTSVKGRPLRMLLVKSEAPLVNRPAMVMTGSTHGNEYLNIEDRLPEELLKKSTQQGAVRDYIQGGGVFIFVPILNPDGYEAKRRTNANGVDLNRDWDLPVAGHTGFKEAETKALAEALEKLRIENSLDYRITVDYHCCAGALLTPWSFKGDSLSEPALTQHHEVGVLASNQLNLTVGATGQVLGYFPTGTTKDYYHTRYDALAFTYEGRYRSESKKLAQHVQWWVDMAEYVDKQLRRATSFATLLDPRLSGLNTNLE